MRSSLSLQLAGTFLALAFHPTVQLGTPAQVGRTVLHLSPAAGREPLSFSGGIVAVDSTSQAWVEN